MGPHTLLLRARQEHPKLPPKGAPAVGAPQNTGHLALASASALQENMLFPKIMQISQKTSKTSTKGKIQLGLIAKPAEHSSSTEVSSSI